MTKRTVTIYCGSHMGNRPAYSEFAAEFGHRLGREGFNMVYGGGKIGLMGITADAALSSGAHVTGIIPELFYNKGQGHEKLSSLILVKDMIERKRRLIDEGDAYVILPGGFGTLEELVDTADWVHLYNPSNPPIIVVNLFGLYDSLKALLNRMEEEGFIPENSWGNLHFVTTVDEIFGILKK